MSSKRRLAAVPDRPQRVVAYIRVSALAGRGGDDFHSPDVQLAAIRRRTVGMLEVAVIDCDVDVPGTTFQREGIEKVRELAEAGHMDVLAVYNVARFGRNTLESLKFLNWLADRGVTIISAKQHIDTSTPSGRKHLTDLLSGAQMQSEEIGEAWADVIEQRAVDGLQHGYAAIGYVKVDKRLVPHPVYGPMMTEIFRRFADDTPTLELAQYYHSITGRRIDTSNLRTMLRRPVYRGLTDLHGETHAGQHQALVDPETWQRVDERMIATRTVPPRHVNPTWALVGLIFCEHCGYRVNRIPHRRRGQDHKEQRLRCGNGKYRVAGGCAGIGMPALAKVEAVVLDRVAAYVRQLRADPAARAAALAQKATARADLAVLERELERNQRGRARLRAKWAVDDADDDTYEEAIRELLDAESAIQAEIKKARQSVAMPDALDVANAAEALLTMWPEMTMAERGRALRTVVNKVIIRKAQAWREAEADRVQVVFL